MLEIKKRKVDEVKIQYLESQVQIENDDYVIIIIR